MVAIFQLMACGPICRQRGGSSVADYSMAFQLPFSNLALSTWGQPYLFSNTLLRNYPGRTRLWEAAAARANLSYLQYTLGLILPYAEAYLPRLQLQARPSWDKTSSCYLQQSTNKICINAATQLHHPTRTPQPRSKINPCSIITIQVQQINNLHIVIHTMFASNFNNSNSLSSPSAPSHHSIRTAIQQYHLQLKLLRERIAMELELNRLLAIRASQINRKQNTAVFNPPPFDFCYQDQTPVETHHLAVKKQHSQASSENQQKKHNSLSYKTDFKANDYSQPQQQLTPKLKLQAHNHPKSNPNPSPQGNQVTQKNETKNIPKNYGKAILSFIQKNIQKYSSVVRPILHKYKLSVSDLLVDIKKHKREVNSIHYLKLIWGFQNFNDPIFKCIRILSHIFMRKYCLPYIFNSRIKNYNTHIKYRRRMLQAIENPAEFTCIKQF